MSLPRRRSNTHVTTYLWEKSRRNLLKLKSIMMDSVMEDGLFLTIAIYLLNLWALWRKFLTPRTFRFTKTSVFGLLAKKLRSSHLVFCKWQLR
jgi:hypothetical protein